MDFSATYGKDVLEYYDKEYYEIQKIKKDIFCMGDELEENVQREKNKLNQLEEANLEKYLRADVHQLME